MANRLFSARVLFVGIVLIWGLGPAILPDRADAQIPQRVIASDEESAMAAVAADLNGDGAPDVVAASLAQDRISWYENRTGSEAVDADGFGPRHVITTAAQWAKDVAAADLDGDGDTDVLSVSSYDDRVAWYENQIDDAAGDSDGFGEQRSITTQADGAQSVDVADVDGDGDPDVLVAAPYADMVAWYENQIGEAGADADGFGSERVITTEAASAYAVTTADLDGDGAPDVISASTYDDRIAWYENRLAESGTFGPQRTISTEADGAASVAVADVDGDGDPDVISASSYDDRIAWYENRLDESDAFGSQQTISTQASYAASVTSADVDGDGDPDVLSASRSDDRVAWYENEVADASADADGFAARRTITRSADEAQSVDAADLDGDGRIDVLSASTNDDKIAWYRNSEGALPVELVRFQARPVGAERVTLVWETASETNSARFDVERRVASSRTGGASERGGGEWRVVGRVEGGGTTRDVRTYRYTDAELPLAADSLVYRLRQVDRDGSVEVFGSVTVARGASQFRLGAPAPNPAQRTATVQFAVPDRRDVTLSLHNVLGQRVRVIAVGETSGRHEVRLDVSSLPSGSYFVRLRAGPARKTERLTVVR